MVKKIISIIILILVLLILGTTIYKIIIRHNDRLYNVLYKEIEYKAKRCFLENKCSKKILLSELYDKGYLDTQYDPVSKEELDKNIVIEITNDKAKINISK